MNTITKTVTIFAMFAAAVLLNLFVQPELEGTLLGGLSIGQIFIVPICFLILLWTDRKNRTRMKKFAIVTITLSVYCIVANFFKWDRVMSNLIPTLCGALVVYLILCYKPAVSA